MSHPHDPYRPVTQPVQGGDSPNAWHEYSPPRKRPVWPWVAAGAGVFVLLALGMVLWAAVSINGQDGPTAEPPAPTVAEPTVAEATRDEPAAEAGGDEGLREYNDTFDDPGEPGDEAGYLDHLLENDREGYMASENTALLGMGRVVCSALDDGHTAAEVLEMFPASLSPDTQASVVAGSVGFLCVEHLERVREEVGAQTGQI